MSEQVRKCKQLFADHFGGECTLVVSAPGRVNLIGALHRPRDGARARARGGVIGAHARR